MPHPFAAKPGRVAHGALPYIAAIVAVALATLVRYALHPVFEWQAPYLLFTLPIVIIALLYGFMPAMFATALAMGVAEYLFVQPAFVLKPLDAASQLRLLVLFGVGVITSVVGDQLKRARQKLRESEERFRLLVEGVQDTAIIFVNARGQVDSWNLGAQRVNGYTADEVIGQPISTFFTKEDQLAGKPQALLERAEREGYVSDEGWRVRRDGTRFWGETILTVLYDGTGAGTVRGFSNITRDRSKERTLLASLQESEQTSRALLEAATQAMIGVGADGAIRIVNAATGKIFGYTPEELIGKPVEMLMPEHVRSRHVVDRSGFFSHGRARPMGQGIDLVGKRKDGSVFPIEASLSLTDTPSGPLAVAFVSDITKRKEIERDLLRERSQLKSILDHSPVLISIKDLEGRFILANKSFLELQGLSQEKVLGQSVFAVYPADAADGIWKSDQEALRARAVVEGETRMRDRHDAWHVYHTIKFPVSYLNTDEPFGVCAFSVDITEQKKVEEKILHAARHDPLTGLPNRALIYELAHQMLGTSKRDKERLAVLFFDLDRFKPINDTYGHETGDRMLQEVARRLTENVRSSDLVGRLGGDEFIAILSEVRADIDAAHAATHLLGCLGMPYQIDTLELRTSPSIGISMYPEDGHDIDTLIRHADAAMYHAKGRGRNTYQFFTPEINTNTERVFALEQRLRNSIDEKNFDLVYQPVIDTRTMHVTGAEALIRWRQDGAQPLLPGEFIAAAEASGLINRLGEWVIQEACRQHQAWRRMGLPPMRIAVNVSPIQFRSKDFDLLVNNAVVSSGIDPHNLELEVTESTVMKQVEEAGKTLADLKRLGLRIALDDFGTGYSSLSYLSQFPIDKLKVDQSFIRHIDTDGRSLAIAETVIALGKKLGVEVVAEGIESEEALDLLRERGCDMGQGYLISAPLAPDAFVSWYRQSDPRRLYH